MTARARLVGLATLLVNTAFLRALAQPPQQTFRTGTDVVLVDVSVRDGGRAVTGLRAADFELRDNNVVQRLESVEAMSLPIDLTLVVDLSSNRHGQWGSDPRLSKVTADIQAEVGQVTKVLRPNDRVRLLVIDTRVQQVWPMQPVSSLGAMPRLQINGMAAVYDTLGAALLHPVDPSRRHVVIARTKGVDTISSIDAEAVKAIAERSGALLHVVAMETAADSEGELRGFQCALMGYCWPTRRFWIPFERRLFGNPPVHPLSQGRPGRRPRRTSHWRGAASDQHALGADPQRHVQEGLSRTFETATSFAIHPRALTVADGTPLTSGSRDRGRTSTFAKGLSGRNARAVSRTDCDSRSAEHLDGVHDCIRTRRVPAGGARAAAGQGCGAVAQRVRRCRKSVARDTAARSGIRAGARQNPRCSPRARQRVRRETTCSIVSRGSSVIRSDRTSSNDTGTSPC